LGYRFHRWVRTCNIYFNVYQTTDKENPPCKKWDTYWIIMIYSGKRSLS
jgi:hypothetical protein